MPQTSIFVMRTVVAACRWPRWRREFFRRLNFTTRTLRPRPCRTTSPATRALARRSRPAMISPSLLTRSTEANSTVAPLSPARRSTAITWPVVTRYCLPPVAITASMRIQPFAGVWSDSRLWNHSGRAGVNSRRSARLQIIRQLLTHPEPRAVHARLHGRQADAERLGDVGVRQSLDVVHHERRPIVGRQPVDRAFQHLAQLAGQRAFVHALGPVGHRLEMTAIAVQGRQHVVERHLARLAATGTQLLVRRVRGDAIEPAAERRLAFERADLARGRPQRVLRRLLGVLFAAGDAQGEPVHAVAEALDKLLGRLGILAPKRLDETGVGVGAGAGRHRHAVTSYVARYRFSSPTHCSITPMSLLSLVSRMAPSSDATRKRAAASESQPALTCPRRFASASASASRACHVVNTDASRLRNPSCTSESSEARLPIAQPPRHWRSRCACTTRSRKHRIWGSGAPVGSAKHGSSVRSTKVATI